MSTLTEIEARLTADRDNFGGGWTDQSIRDREALLGMVRELEGKLGSVAYMVDRAEMHGNHTLYVHEVSEVLGPTA